MKITHFDARYPWNLGNTVLSQGGGVSVDTGNSGSIGGGTATPISVTDGSTTVNPATEIDFTGAVVTDGGGGVAEVTISGAGSTIIVEDEGTPLATAADTLNFVGAGVTATGTGTTKTITIPGGGGSTNVVNVLDYGAVEDFSTDNSVAFAAAVAAMADGCTLVFPSITGLGYKTSTGITISTKGCLIAGTGSEYGTRVHITASNTTLFTIAPSWDGTRNQTNLIRGLLITGPGSASAWNSSYGVYAASDVHLEDVGLVGFGTGLYWGTSTFYSRAFGCFSTNCIRGVVMDGTNNCTLDTCRLTGDFGGGGVIGPMTDGVVMATGLVRGLVNRIVNCSIEYFSGDGIRLNGGASTEIVGNYFETQESSTGHAHIVIGEGNATYSTRIASNYFQGDGTSGFDAIAMDHANGVVISDNYFGINAAIGISSTANTSNVLLWNNTNSPAGTFSLPASSYTLDPASPPISGTPTGDLTGSYPSPTVARINGVAVTGTPAVGYVPTATSSGAATWQPGGAGAAWRPVMVADLDGTHWDVLVDGYGNAIVTS